MRPSLRLTDRHCQPPPTSNLQPPTPTHHPSVSPPLGAGATAPSTLRDPRHFLNACTSAATHRTPALLSPSRRPRDTEI